MSNIKNTVKPEIFKGCIIDFVLPRGLKFLEIFNGVMVEFRRRGILSGDGQEPANCFIALVNVVLASKCGITRELFGIRAGKNVGIFLIRICSKDIIRQEEWE